jgi:hypothetical protein
MMVVTPEKVHEEAWMRAVEGARSDAFDRYGIHASRVLALRHPEVLLEADVRFVTHITTNRGYSHAYALRDVHSMEFLNDRQFRKYPPFSFDAVDFDALKTVGFRELYPERYPVLPFLDRRLMPAATTLKTRDGKVTELEKVALHYQKERVGRGEARGLFVVYCENERAYLYDGGRLSNAEGEMVEEVDGAPILIFNEKVAWYPLMERDDTAIDESLEKVVNDLREDRDAPNLTPFEKDVIDRLHDLTDLRDGRQHAMAVIVCNRSTGRQTCTAPFSDWLPFHALWDEALPTRKARAWQYYGYLEQILIRADKLSPITAYLASLSLNSTGYDRLVSIEKEWLSRVALPNYGYVWGHIWDECLVEYSVGESFRTSAGHCMVQGMIISAVLEMAGIDNYLMEGEVPGSHHYNYLPDYEFSFDNARLSSCRNNVMLNWPKGNKVLARFHHNGKFCSPIAGDHYSGTWSPEECVAELDYLAGIYGNKLLIYGNGEHETSPTLENRENRAITDDYRILLDEEWEDLKLP